MAKLTFALAAVLAASATAFAPQPAASKTVSLSAVPEGVWDPLSLGELGTGEAFDTFPTMFPHKQFIAEAEIKHGRMCMLAWTGIWATHVVSNYFRWC
jgi:hypothetical protein